MVIDYMSNIKDMVYICGIYTQALRMMTIDDTSNIKDVILSLEDININNGDHK